MPRPRPIRWLIPLTLLAATCTTVHQVDRRLVAPEALATANGRSPWLKAHLRDGSVLVLQQWTHDSAAGALSGSGQRLDLNRVRVDSGLLRVAFDSIAIFETNVVTPSSQHGGMTVITGISLIMTAGCLMNPKACFGSCPTFYVEDGTGDAGGALMAEGYSSSVAPGLEATDLDALWLARPATRDVTLRMTNEAYETHVVRSLTLVAVPRPADARVVAVPGGGYVTAHAPASPRRCAGPDGDCLAALSAYDGTMRSSRADSTDLATRETLDLDFDAPGDGPLGVIVSSRQTLMSTYLFYQALAWMGENAAPWMGRLSATARSGGPGAVLGKLEIVVQDSTGTWVVAGTVGETGPLATDTKAVRLPTSVRGDQPVRVQLRGTQGLWRIDQVQLARVTPAAEPVRLAPVAVRRGGVVQPEALARLLDDDATLVTFPGDEYAIEYRLPGDPSGYELLLESRGYYLEWMREEWLAESDATRAAQLLLDPRRALKDLAPAYVRQEATMDSIFWRSRYVRR